MMGNFLLPTPLFDTSACGQQQLLTLKLAARVQLLPFARVAGVFAGQGGALWESLNSTPAC